ncbi:MAG: tetratricopeptide 2 repeat protein [Candidatus Brocadiaceae bacterium]|nr:tetratricopeptide 2 repeat protein [Candidatus Brocadiaceae bacterium]
MPRAYWSPLYLAAEESLVSRSGLLNFFHDYLRKAVEDRYFHDTIKKCLDTEKKRLAHLRLADYFDKKELDARKVDELPWLLRQAEARDRLRACLLDIDQFLLIQKRDQNELMVYWVWLREEREMGEGYLESFESWSGKPGNQDLRTSYAANGLVVFLLHAALHAEAEPFMRRALRIDEQSFGENHPNVAIHLNNLAQLLQATNRLAEAEPLCRRMVEIFLQFTSKTGHTHPHLHAATNNYAGLLHAMGHSAEDIRDDLKKLGKRFVVDLGGTGGHANAQPSPKLRAVIEQLNRDPSKAQEIFGKLQREDPALLQELIPLIQRQQQK